MCGRFVNDAEKFDAVEGVIGEFGVGSSTWMVSFILGLHFIRISPRLVMNTSKAGQIRVTVFITAIIPEKNWNNKTIIYRMIEELSHLYRMKLSKQIYHDAPSIKDS